MPLVTLKIESPDGRQTLALESELSIGRTNQADIAINDPGLSRVNSFLENKDGEVWIYDENSTNGTFVNGERITERQLHDHDEITIGNETRISVEIDRKAPISREVPPKPTTKSNIEPQKSKVQPAKNPQQFPIALVAGVGSSLLIIFLGIAAFIFVQQYKASPSGSGTTATPRVVSGAEIPIRVVDPLGGEDPDDLDDLIASWEVEDAPLNIADIGEVTSKGKGSTAISELNVSPAVWAKQRELAFSPRSSGVGNDPAGTQVPPQLFGDGVIKQKRKLAEMKSILNYQQPLDFSDLAAKRIARELIELPMATDWYFLDVGGSASEGEFQSFDFDNGSAPIAPNSPKFQTIKKLADNFDGQKYDLNNPRDRKQIRIRLLRMFNQKAKPILERLAKAYHGQFKRPLRVTSLTRSMDYQISLNKNNANSFKVRDKNSLPPHTSGCAFDLARKHMTAAEQNFVMAELAKMENEGLLDALREGGANACFHVFIYADGKEPK
jgi:pSer/pThr/pTyr-binding forkhead associated (FHA) protein